MTSKAAAFIGAGNQAPMARCSRCVGLELIICDRDQTVLDAFAQEGAAATVLSGQVG